MILAFPEAAAPGISDVELKIHADHARGQVVGTLSNDDVEVTFAIGGPQDAVQLALVLVEVALALQEAEP